MNQPVIIREGNWAVDGILSLEKIVVPEITVGTRF